MPLNLNIATQSELMKLPGIGKIKAETIIRLRDKYGKVDKELFLTVLGKNPGQEYMQKISFDDYPIFSFQRDFAAISLSLI